MAMVGNRRFKAMVGLLFCAAAIVAVVSCAQTTKPKSFVQSFDQAANWRVVEIRDELIGKPDIWRIVVDTVAEKYDLEVLERDSGYLRTAWKHTYATRGQVVDRYRSRVVVKLDETLNQARIKVESHWMDNTGWLVGYDSILLETIYHDLQGKIGRTIR